MADKITWWGNKFRTEELSGIFVEKHLLIILWQFFEEFATIIVGSVVDKSDVVVSSQAPLVNMNQICN